MQPNQQTITSKNDWQRLNQSRSSGWDVFPGWWNFAGFLVVSGQSVNSWLDQNQTKFGILVLSVSFQMLADGDGTLDHVVNIFREIWGKTLSLQDSQDLVTSNETDLGNTMGIPEDNTFIIGPIYCLNTSSFEFIHMMILNLPICDGERPFLASLKICSLTLSEVSFNHY